MKERERPRSAIKVEQARAKAAELDRQARELERLAASENWQRRARIREAADRLRIQAGQCLARAQRSDIEVELELTVI